MDNKRTLVEDLGPEENFHGIKPLSIESSLIAEQRARAEHHS